MAVFGLHFCVRAFSSCGKWGPLFIAVRGPLTIAASRCGAQALQQDSQPVVDSQPLRHQGSPRWYFFYYFFFHFLVIHISFIFNFNFLLNSFKAINFQMLEFKLFLKEILENSGKEKQNEQRNRCGKVRDIFLEFRVRHIFLERNYSGEYWDTRRNYLESVCEGNE